MAFDADEHDYVRIGLPDCVDGQSVAGDTGDVGERTRSSSITMTRSAMASS